MDAMLELPALPLPRVRALALLTDEERSVRDIAAVVTGDPALTVALLRAANAAISAPTSRVRSAEQAIVRIGIGATRRIILGAVAGNAFEHLSRAGIQVDALWRHVIATALIAETVARVGEGSTDAFTAGLLHDVGRMAMASQDPNRYARVVSLARRGVSVHEAERVMFGADHQEVGAALAEAWRLPEDIVDAVGAHHDEHATASLCRAVARGRSIAGRLGLGDGVTPASASVLDPDSADGAVVRELRGSRALLSRVEWYREAIQEF